MDVQRVFWMIGAIYGFLGVGFGAFGAHALKAHLGADVLATYEVGVRYQLFHACVLLAVSWASTRWPGKVLLVGGWLIAGGTLVFSGSLYLLCLSGQRVFGAITPLGGAALLAGWLLLAASAWRGSD